MSRSNLLRTKVPTAASPVSAAVTPVKSLPNTNFDISKFIYYGALFFLIIIILVAIFKVSTIGIFSIDFSTGLFTTIPVSQTMKMPAQYKTAPISAVDSTTFPSVLQVEYSVGFDIYISDGTPVQNNYRLIFYNGMQSVDSTLGYEDPSQQNNLGQALSFVAPGTLDSNQNSVSTIDPTSMISIQTALSANYSNLCVFMAPDTNDLYVTYFVGNIQPGLRESSGMLGPDIETMNGWNISNPIKNVPIGKPFRLSLVVDKQFIEVYMNGELVLTTKTYIPGQTTSLHTYSTSVNYNFYGPPDVMYLKGIYVANINYWNAVLPSKSIRVFSSSPVSKSIFTT